MKRDKREKFIELTEKRVTKTLDSIRLIGNLSDKRYQEGYTNKNKLRSTKGIDIDKWCWDRKLKNWRYLLVFVVSQAKF